MEWREIYNKTNMINSKTVNQNMILELYLLFPISRWNKIEQRKVLTLYYSDYKSHQTKWFGLVRNIEKYKRCKINFSYVIQHLPVQEFDSYNSYYKTMPDYENFTLEFCKKQAVIILQEHINNINQQLTII